MLRVNRTLQTSQRPFSAKLTRAYAKPLTFVENSQSTHLSLVTASPSCRTMHQSANLSAVPAAAAVVLPPGISSDVVMALVPPQNHLRRIRKSPIINDVAIFTNLQHLFNQETTMALQRLSRVLKYGAELGGKMNAQTHKKRKLGQVDLLRMRSKPNFDLHAAIQQQPILKDHVSSLHLQPKQHQEHEVEKVRKDASQEHPLRRYNMAELLQQFDAQSPPPPDASLLDIQLWLECESQRESVLRMEAALQSARTRQDFTSLPAIRRHLLSWYHPLRSQIEAEQRLYLSGGENKQGKVDVNRYGPYLCTIQPEKLAIITTHEAVMFALGKGGGIGSTLMLMALRIGNAVEAEVNVQKALRKQLTDRQINTAQDASTIIQPENMEQSPHSGHNHTKKMNDKGTTDDWMYGASHLQQFIDELNKNSSKKTRIRIQLANRRAQKILQSSDEWTTADKVKLGGALIKMLLDTAKLYKDGTPIPSASCSDKNDDQSLLESGEPAFTYEKRWVNEKKLVGHIVMNERLYRDALEDKFESFAGYTTRHQPMVVPPRQWTGPKDGGYYALNVDLMRTHGCHKQREALYEADLSTVFDGLYVLGRVPWRINQEILDVAQKCWDEGIVLGDIPSRVDHHLPPAPLPIPYDMNSFKDKTSPAYKTAVAEYKSYCEAKLRYTRTYQKNMDLRSLRCSALLKLNQAQKFKSFEKIYFPYNLDFRGRAYPVPPHLSNVGSDLCRGMLKFSHSKPLGSRGLFWLKVHLANLAGANKMSFEDRAQFTDNNMENIRACVNNPFGENRWWMKLDDPFQGLATCYEIIRAIDSGDPSSYECALAVHMDGSCNGLQHYAALGRDKIGGKAVNLCNFDAPQDVYIGVMHEVIRRVAEEASNVLNFEGKEPTELTKSEKDMLKCNRAAKLVDGLIDRGVVKRTVMTSVYGVTYIGARKQIQEKIEEKLKGKGYDVDEIEHEIHSACGYLARVTMEVIGELFIGAKLTMNWLASCARLIASQGQPVTWMSAIGVPAVQPYRQKKPYTIVTLLQSVVLINNSDALPIHKQRQVSAFPPNYVHSLDSSHMLLTALEMDRRGLTFSAVHDSFWTHACDIDEMNDVLRHCFVDLYSRPLLEELKQTWELQYPSLQFPDLPEKGELDLKEVAKARYFFQ